MLTPHQMPVYKKTNIHEILERVRSLILSEFSSDITFHQRLRCQSSRIYCGSGKTDSSHFKYCEKWCASNEIK